MQNKFRTVYGPVGLKGLNNRDQSRRIKVLQNLFFVQRERLTVQHTQEGYREKAHHIIVSLLVIQNQKKGEVVTGGSLFKRWFLLYLSLSAG